LIFEVLAFGDIRPRTDDFHRLAVGIAYQPLFIPNPTVAFISVAKAVSPGSRILA